LIRFLLDRPAVRPDILLQPPLRYRPNWPPETVTAAAATQLVVTTQPPASVTAGSDFGLAAAAEDAQGNVVTTFAGSVTLALASNPGGSTLGGTLTLTATQGVATFSGLTLDKAGSGYTLQASSSGLTSATSSPFDVTSVALSGNSVYEFRPINEDEVNKD